MDEQDPMESVPRDHEMDDLELPPMFRGHDIEVPYTPEQLAPTIKRLHDALEIDFAAGGTPQQRLAAAWTRIAELRLPRKAVPNVVLDEVERLVSVWDGLGQGGIVKQAFALSDAAVARERERIAWMLTQTEAASSQQFPIEMVPTE